MWVALALFAALVNASRHVYEKELTEKLSNFTIGFLVLSFAIIPTALLLPIFPLPESILHLPWNFWWPLLIIWLVLYPLQTHFAMRALREGNLSDTTPVIALLPGINTVTSYMIIGELPTTLGFVGIGLVVAATFLLLVNGRSIRALSINTPTLFAATSVACVALGTTLDKVSILASTPIFYTFVNITGGAVVLGVLSYFYGNRGEIKHVLSSLRPLTIFGVLRALSTAASMFAFSLGPTAYVLAIRSSSFLFSSAYGLIKLREAPTLRKILALALFIAGLVLIALF